MTALTATRPFGKLDAQARVIPSSFGDLAFQGAYSSNNLIYFGQARPGSSTSDAVWKISYLTYDGSGNLLTIQWPQDTNGNASSEYIFIWEDRAGYTYS
jgi:hypothetical protein